MPDIVAFTPKAAYADPDCLGAVYVNDTTEVNVRELVAASADGTFVVTDPAVIAVLDRYEPLKRAAAPDRAPETPAGEPATPLENLTRRELLALPEARALEGADHLKVEELRDAIRTAREGGDA